MAKFSMAKFLKRSKDNPILFLGRARAGFSQMESSGVRFTRYKHPSARQPESV